MGASTSAAGRVVVIGSANRDYLIRLDLPPEPGETTLAYGMTKSTGGKGANQAVAAARLGAHVQFVGCVGKDDDGAVVRRALERDGIDTSALRTVEEPTGIALVSIDDDGENSIVVVPGANFELTTDQVRKAVRFAAGAAGKAGGSASGGDEAGVIVLQAEIPRELIQLALVEAEKVGVRAVFNLAPFTYIPDDVLRSCDPLVLNESEAAALVGRMVHRREEAVAAASELAQRVRSVVITLGSDGAVWASGDESGTVPAVTPARVVDTTGAGDGFVGAVAWRLACGDSLADAAGWGAAVGGFAVSRPGAQDSYPSRRDLGRQ